MEVLCVVVWLEHSARSHAEYVNAARASEQLNVEAREANELTQSRGVEWNEAGSGSARAHVFAPCLSVGPMPARRRPVLYTDNKKVDVMGTETRGALVPQPRVLCELASGRFTYEYL